MSKKFIIIIFSVFIFFGFLSLLWHFVFTSRETANVLSQSFFRQMIQPQGKILGEIDGNIHDGIVIRNLELTALKGFPVGTTFNCAWLSLKWNGFTADSVSVLFENIRLKLPQSDPIIFSGKYFSGNFSINVFSTNIDIGEMLLLGKEKNLFVEGRISDLDIDIAGTKDFFKITGKLTAQKISYGGFQLIDANGGLDLGVRFNSGQYFPRGEVVVNEGELQMPKVLVHLQKSRLVLGDDWKNPGLDLSGTTSIDGTDIDLSLKGMRAKPDLKVSSLPSLPKEKILLMLVTGKGWKGLDKIAQTQKFSPDLIADVIDYLWLGGQEVDIGKKLGIKDISLLFEEKRKGFGLRKIITDSLDFGYFVSQDAAQTRGSLDQKFEAELKVNRNISLTVDKELRSPREENFEGAITPQSEDKFWLKFKSAF